MYNMFEKFENFINESSAIKEPVKVNGVEINHSFTDNNGKKHENGYKIVRTARYMSLQKLIEKLIAIRGNDCDLNDIDVSENKDFIHTFYHTDFNGDISGWDVSNAERMDFLFSGCDEFNCDLSKWNVSKVHSMHCMFEGCRKFKQELNHWDVREVADMGGMFAYCDEFNGDISDWDVSHVKDFGDMFYKCKRFNQDLSNWKVNDDSYMTFMFKESGVDNPPKWYKFKKEMK